MPSRLSPGSGIQCNLELYSPGSIEAILYEMLQDKCLPPKENETEFAFGEENKIYQWQLRDIQPSKTIPLYSK
ncbi:MAG: hypothetical protein JWM28_2736, partial [Chitinophagaceae bacterium]|nr:hypothetical protein [Chitinophagaceae bacterium]